ncbi:hypothetical protein [Marinifilum fragile]|uniref:hypothetical protein n=1 Tax=Marinifilum fragile TaxID=570161 RepID=UPI002AA66F2F|nr:hypothetical protein [Marinifilum fragile]
MKYLFTIAIALLLFACSSDDEQHVAHFGLSFDFSVLDSDGNDLLNPNNENSFKESDIKLYYLINGEKKEVYNPNMDSPRNFFIYQEGSDAYRIRIFLNDTESEEKTITYILWNNIDSDTISAEVYRNSKYNLTRMEKVWFNGQLIYELTDNTTESFYKLIK